MQSVAVKNPVFDRTCAGFVRQPKGGGLVPLLLGAQFTFVQRFQQLYFLIHYCCDTTRKVRAPEAVRRSGAPDMYWSHVKKTFYKKTPFTELNLRSIEHV
jgi:hypothetical protein